MAVGQSLISVANEIEDREFKEYLNTFQSLIDSAGFQRIQISERHLCFLK